MARGKLSDEQRVFVGANLGMSAEELLAALPGEKKGVGVKTVQKLVDTLQAAATVAEVVAEPVEEVVTEQPKPADPPQPW